MHGSAGLMEYEGCRPTSGAETAADASASVSVNTLGTTTWHGPFDSISLTLDPWVTIDPATGTVERTSPEFTVLEQAEPMFGFTANPWASRAEVAPTVVSPSTSVS